MKTGASPPQAGLGSHPRRQSPVNSIGLGKPSLHAQKAQALSSTHAKKIAHLNMYSIRFQGPNTTLVTLIMPPALLAIHEYQFTAGGGGGGVRTEAARANAG